LISTRWAVGAGNYITFTYFNTLGTHGVPNACVGLIRVGQCQRWGGEWQEYCSERDACFHVSS
jgi:hypothetical protein